MVPDFASLFASAGACRRCSAMGCRPVLSGANGPAGARVLFVGEAPGRLGAGRTGVPFSGDVAGQRFEILLAAAGLRRHEVFVTNAVLCLPLDGAGRNRPPRRSEVANCSSLLRRTIEYVAPELVVGMGAVALSALQAVERHELRVAAAGAPPVAWHGRWLAATYHPAARSQVHRPLARQIADWQALGRWLPETIAHE